MFNFLTLLPFKCFPCCCCLQICCLCFCIWSTLFLVSAVTLPNHQKSSSLSFSVCNFSVCLQGLQSSRTPWTIDQLNAPIFHMTFALCGLTQARTYHIEQKITISWKWAIKMSFHFDKGFGWWLCELWYILAFGNAELSNSISKHSYIWFWQINLEKVSHFYYLV